jgi:hypothetical protein
MWPAYLEYAFDTTRVAGNLIYHEQHALSRHQMAAWRMRAGVSVSGAAAAPDGGAGGRRRKPPFLSVGARRV